MFFHYIKLLYVFSLLWKRKETTVCPRLRLILQRVRVRFRKIRTAARIIIHARFSETSPVRSLFLVISFGCRNIDPPKNNSAAAAVINAASLSVFLSLHWGWFSFYGHAIIHRGISRHEIVKPTTIADICRTGAVIETKLISCVLTVLFCVISSCCPRIPWRHRRSLVVFFFLPKIASVRVSPTYFSIFVKVATSPSTSWNPSEGREIELCPWGIWQLLRHDR